MAFYLGAIVNVYGRQVILVDCDQFTKEFYAKKYGINEFTPIAIPEEKKEPKQHKSIKQRELPIWNGWGSHEDSAQNCRTVEPKAPLKDFKKFLQYDRYLCELLYLSRILHLHYNNFCLGKEWTVTF